MIMTIMITATSTAERRLVAAAGSVYDVIPFYGVCGRIAKIASGPRGNPSSALISYIR